MKLIDTHCHLNFNAFKGDFSQDEENNYGGGGDACQKQIGGTVKHPVEETS